MTKRSHVVMAGLTWDALVAVARERERQEAIGVAKRAQGIDWRSCADPALEGGNDRRLAILAEEFGEVARAVLELAYASDPAFDAAHLRDELVQVAAVSVAWVEEIDQMREAAADVAQVLQIADGLELVVEEPRRIKASRKASRRPARRLAIPETPAPESSDLRAPTPLHPELTPPQSMLCGTETPTGPCIRPISHPGDHAPLRLS